MEEYVDTTELITPVVKKKLPKYIFETVFFVVERSGRLKYIATQ